jgi:undecaprenyl-diphosphatase
MNPFDSAILHWFNSFAGRNHVFDVVTAAFTNYAPVLFALLFLGYFFLTRTETGRMRRTVILSGLSGVVAVVLVLVISHFFYRARPFVATPDMVRQLIPHPNDSSFPSDHATGSAAFAAGMWRAPSRSAAWIFTVVAVLVGLSRLVAGVHWPTDILASFVLGWAAAQLTFALGRPLAPLLDRIVGIFDRGDRRVRTER